MPSTVIVDSGVLLAAVNSADPWHVGSVELLSDSALTLLVPALCVAEVCFLIGRRFGSAVEAAFLKGLGDFEVEAPLPEDWPRIAELVERYRDLPLGGTDASVAVLADRCGTRRIATLDRRDFGVLRSVTGEPYELLPDFPEGRG